MRIYTYMQVYLCKTATECNLVLMSAACTAVSPATTPSASTTAPTYYEIVDTTPANKLNCPTVRVCVCLVLCMYTCMYMFDIFGRFVFFGCFGGRPQRNFFVFQNADRA